MMRSLRGCVLPALIVALLVGCGTPASGQDDESLQDAKVLFQEALKLRKEGKGADALRTFEKSIRMNRGVLSEDDQGLVQELREEYSRKLASAPEDVALLEGMAFIHAVCESDYAKAVELYSKVLAKATDPEVKTRTERLIERLRGLQEANRSTTDDIAARHREERVKAWAEMEKHDDLAAKAEAKQQKEEKLSEMYRRRDDLDARQPSLEDEIKSLEDEVERAHRMYLTTNERRYKWKEDRLEADLNNKKKEIEKNKGELAKLQKDIDKLNKEIEAGEKPEKGSGSGTASAPAGMPDGQMPPDGPPGSGDGSIPPDGQSSPDGGPGYTPKPYDNPDFPGTGTPGGTESGTESMTDTGTGMGTDTGTTPDGAPISDPTLPPETGS